MCIGSQAGGKRTIAPHGLKIWKKSEIFGSDVGIFEQNNSFSKSDKNISSKSEVSGSRKDVFGKTKFFMPQKQLKFEVNIFFSEITTILGPKIEKLKTDLHIEDFSLFLSLSKFGKKSEGITHSFKVMAFFLSSPKF